MCGEIDDKAVAAQELIERFQAMARQLGLDETALASTPPDLAREEDRASYMERVFRLGLAQALAEVAAAEDEDEDEAAVDALALRAIALARLAGFLAGQLPPEADLFRALIEAMTSGHAEPREMDHHHSHDLPHDHPRGRT
jgi:hypothetical protein